MDSSGLPSGKVAPPTAATDAAKTTTSSSSHHHATQPKARSTAMLQSQAQQARPTPRLSSIMETVTHHARHQTHRLRPSPALLAITRDINAPAVALAATAESFYRSALNAVLNRQLTGSRSIPLFPSMHVQVPARVLYITGFKTLRAFFSRAVNLDAFEKRQRSAMQLAVTLAPGLVMTPIASLLEACNVGAVNAEPLLMRACRGVVPRAGREVIFGLGLNQLSDYFEARYRMQWGLSPVLATTAGSLSAGVAAGYLSHIPHNLSTLRMLHPDKSYAQLFQTLVDKSVPKGVLTPVVGAGGGGSPVRGLARALWTVLWPKGLVTRTVQICGSFAILNGIIHLVERDARRRRGRVAEHDEAGDVLPLRARASNKNT